MIGAAWGLALLVGSGFAAETADPSGSGTAGVPRDGGEDPASSLPPHIRRLTLFGERADWSHDGKRILFLSKTYGDAFEIEVETGRRRPGPLRLRLREGPVQDRREPHRQRAVEEAVREAGVEEDLPGLEPLFELQGIKFGIQLCYDAHFPELSTRMPVAGAEIIFMPHASPRGTPQGKLNSWMRHLSARASDNSVFIVACNQIGKNQKGLDFPGVALILEPSGEGKA